MIGYHSGLICSYKTCLKDGTRKNYEGSSKGMEPHMAIELHTNNDLFEEKQVYGARLIMDDDSTTLAGLQKVSPNSVIKWSDKIHSSKNFKKSLYALKLSKPLIVHFSSNFYAAIEENKGDVEGLSSALKAIVRHAFGEHNYCLFHEEKENYHYKNLPNNTPLQNEQLKISLNDLISKYTNNAEKLAPAASTQANESFNNTMSSFCPRNKHYSNSESLDYRMAAAVCQKK